MSKLRQPLEFRNVIDESKLGDILAIDAVVSTLEGDTVIPDVSVSIYYFIQLTIPVIRIQLEFVGFHYG